MLTGRAGLSAEGGGRLRTPSGRGEAGPWARSVAGPKGAPMPFFFFFSFSFSVFLFVSQILQNRFKTIQTNAENFIKFKIVLLKQ
jgi:hypothetical protein